MAGSRAWWMSRASRVNLGRPMAPARMIVQDLKAKAQAREYAAAVADGVAVGDVTRTTERYRPMVHTHHTATARPVRRTRTNRKNQFPQSTVRMTIEMTVRAMPITPPPRAKQDRMDPVKRAAPSAVGAVAGAEAGTARAMKAVAGVAAQSRATPQRRAKRAPRQSAVASPAAAETRARPLRSHPHPQFPTRRPRS